MQPFFAGHRAYSPGEFRADATVHAIGVVGALSGSVILLSHAGASWVLASYLFGLVAMVSCSAAYNLTPPSHLKWIFRRFDHSAIYLLIAGTYTPLLPFLPDAAQGWRLGLITWVGVFGGMLARLCVGIKSAPINYSLGICIFVFSFTVSLARYSTNCLPI